jgi:hypothetical protein
MRVLKLVGAVVILCAASSAVADPAISQIRAEYQAIRKALPTYSEESVNLADESTEGGEAKVYRDQQKGIRLIRTDQYSEMGKTLMEFYYQNGSLIFAYREDHQYNVPFYMTPEIAKEVGSEPFDHKKTKIVENRYCFLNGKMIRWLDEAKKQIDTRTTKFKDAETAILDFSNHFSSVAQQKPPVTQAEWGKCMVAASSRPGAPDERQVGKMGGYAYALSRCGFRPTAMRADGKAMLAKRDCDRVYEIAEEAFACEEFGGSVAGNHLLQSLDDRAFDDTAFWKACKHVQAGSMSRAVFGKQICGE